MRSARPSGSLLSDRDLAPPVASDFHAAVNKEWDERSLAGLSPRQANDVEPVARSRGEKEPDALVVIHGPGGFPLLGAVAIGHRRRNPATDVGDVAAPPALRDGDPQVVARLAALELPANPHIPMTEEGATAQSRALRVRPWGGFPVSFFSGLGLATIFTLNAVLSQPLAGFDFLSSRLDAGAGLRSNRRERLRKTRSGA